MLDRRCLRARSPPVASVALLAFFHSSRRRLVVQARKVGGHGSPILSAREAYALQHLPAGSAITPSAPAVFPPPAALRRTPLRSIPSPNGRGVGQEAKEVGPPCGAPSFGMRRTAYRNRAAVRTDPACVSARRTGRGPCTRWSKVCNSAETSPLIFRDRVGEECQCSVLRRINGFGLPQLRSPETSAPPQAAAPRPDSLGTEPAVPMLYRSRRPL